MTIYLWLSECKAGHSEANGGSTGGNCVECGDGKYAGKGATSCQSCGSNADTEGATTSGDVSACSK